MRRALSILLLAAAAQTTAAQERTTFSRIDSLRGTNSPARSWWDVTFYDLRVAINPADSTIRGSNAITYRVLRPASEMQIDLQAPMIADSMLQDGQRLVFRRDSSAFFVTLPAAQARGATKTVTIHYHGRPRVARNPPWDGGFGWGTDSLGRPFVSTTNEGLGASVWWPNKDLSSEEPDSQRIAITVPDPIVDISNGRLRNRTRNADGTTTFEWFVANPINNYNVAVNAGMYEHFADTLIGEKGRLSMDFWALSYNVDAAKRQFAQAKSVLKCFEHWFGPYPWYADGYKLIQTGHLGMEHQSAVAYGNGFRKGCRGRDLSGTGLGMTWDFIVVHETAHEWWGNNVSSADHADMWIHEAFGNYSEGIYQECLTSKADGAKYIIGSRRNIRNDAPIIGHYGVNNSGSGDMYYKGGSMLHTIRQIIGNDATWRSILRGINATFGRRTTSGREIEEYINARSGINFDKVFAQYLMTTRIPVFEYDIQGTTLWYRWNDVVPGFDMPVRATVTTGTSTVLRPTERWQSVPLRLRGSDAFSIDENFHVRPMPVVRQPVP